MNARLSFSIRYKVLALVATILIAALATYLLLATRLFTRDKVTYIFDLNGALAHTMAAEVQATVETLADKLVYFSGEHLEEHQPVVARPPAVPQPKSTNRRRRAAHLLPRKNDPAASSPQPSNRWQPVRPGGAIFRLFAGERDLLALEVWQRQAGGGYQRTHKLYEAERFSAHNLTTELLDDARRAHPISPAAVAGEQVVMQNSSLDPDLALITLAVSARGGALVLIADLKPDRLLRIFGEDEAYSSYLVDRRGTLLVHPDPKKVLAAENVLSWPIVQDAVEGQPTRGVRRFGAGENESIAAFARIGPGRLAAIAETPMKEALKASTELVRQSTLFAIGILLTAVLVSIFFSRRLSAPIQRLRDAAQTVAGGQFDVNVPVTSRDEVGALAQAFNAMARELKDRDQRLEESHSQLVQSEKLAAIGEISAGVSHEVRNPLGGILGFAQLGAKVTSLEEAKEYFGNIEAQGKRAKAILDNLLRFTRQEAEMSPINLNEVILDTLRLCDHQLKEGKVARQTLFDDDLPKVMGNANQVQQVLLNLVLNAQQAMESQGGGTVRVTTALRDGRWVVVKISDTGPGIPPEVMQKLFRPFFTTKAAGKGTGLGLSVSQSIVVQHKGQLKVESTVGQGTTFSILLPPLAG